MGNENLWQRLKEAGVDVEGSLDRFMGNEDLYMRFLRKFPEDSNYVEMVKNMREKDYDSLLKSSHALKGLTGNLGMDYLYERLSTMVEDLRAGRYDRLEELYGQLKVNYEDVCRILTDNADRKG